MQDLTEVMARPPLPLPAPPADPPSARGPLGVLLAALGMLIVVALLVGPRAASAVFPVDRQASVGASAPVAKEPPAVARVMPNVIGRSVSDAGAMLIAAGYRSPVSWRADPAAAGQPCSVVRQEPPAGTTVVAGAQATLVIVRGACR